MKEKLYPIPEFENLYFITRSGKIWSPPKKWKVGFGSDRFHNGKFLRLQKDTSGYHIICLVKDKKKIMRKVGRLVAKTFIPNPENKPQINHKNGIKTDDGVENLEWCTGKENIRHAWKTGLSKTHYATLNNSLRSTRKLSFYQAQSIRKEKQKTKISNSELASKYKVSKAIIGNIVNNKTYLRGVYG